MGETIGGMDKTHTAQEKTASPEASGEGPSRPAEAGIDAVDRAQEVTCDPLAGLSAEQIKAERDAAKLGPLLALQLALLVAQRKKGHE